MRFGITSAVFFVLLSPLGILVAEAQSTGISRAQDLMEQGYRLQERKEYDSARLFFERAAIILKGEGDDQAFVEAVVGTSRSYYKLDRLEKIKDVLEPIWPLIESEKIELQHAYIVDAYNFLGRYYWNEKGDFPQSISLLQKALALYEAASLKKPKLMISIQENLGYAYGFMAKYEEALDAFTTALDLTIENYGEAYEYLGGCYTNLAFAYVQQGDWEEAEKAMKNSIEINLKNNGPDHPNLATNYNNMGYIYSVKNDFDQAILYTNKALNLAKKLYGEDDRSVRIAYMNLTKSYLKKKDFEESLRFNNKALNVLNQRVSQAEKNPDRATIYLNMGSIYHEQGKDEEALDYFNQVLEIEKEIYGPLGPEMITSYQTIGKFFLETGKLDQTANLLDKANTIVHEHMAGNQVELAETYQLMGKYHFQRLDYAQSLKLLQRSLVALVPTFNDSDIHATPELNNVISYKILLESLKEKTKVLYKDYLAHQQLSTLETAYQTASITDQAVDSIRIGYQAAESKALLVGKLQPFYELAIEVALQLHQLSEKREYLEKVFYYMERNKSMLLLENLLDVDNLKFANISESLVKKEQLLKRDIEFYREQLYEARSDEPDIKKIAVIENHFFNKKRDYDLLRELFKEKYPNYFQLKYRIPYISLSEAQKLLPPGTTLLEYFVGDNQIFLLAISSDKVAPYLMEKNTNFDEQINQFRQQATNAEAFFDDPQANLKFSHAAFQFYKKLVSQALKDFSTTDKLVVIPDGVLGYLPFELLTQEESDGLAKNDFKGLSYLIHDYTISYAYSSTHLMSQQNRGHSNKSLIFGGFAPSYSSQRSESNRNSMEAGADLPGALGEVNSIAELLGGEAWLGTDASEINFKDQANRFDILHLSMHGLLDDQNPLYSRLIFTPASDTLEDGFLKTFEIYNLDLNARMVVLSACNTNTGQIRKGEGIMSLSRAFAYAGCPSMVASLWKADDQATSKIMIHFYQFLKEGLEKDEALRKAKLQFLEENERPNWNHPYYWSAFVPLGTMESLPMKKGLNLSVGVLLGLLLAVLATGLYFMRKRHWRFSAKN